MLLILVSAVVSCLVSYATAKYCFKQIDAYVKETTEELSDALDKFMDFCLKNK